MAKPWKLAVGALGVALVAIVGTPGTAFASVSQCKSGNVCLWGENTYSGCFAQYSGNQPDYTKLTWQQTCRIGVRINDGANSVKNHGTRCSVALFQNIHYTGPAILFNSQAQGYNYEDPKLGNGGGTGYNGHYNGQNWQDRISSHKWCL